MMGDGFLGTNGGSKGSPKKTSAATTAAKKKKKKRGGAKRKMTVEQAVAHRAVSEWVSLGGSSMSSDSDFGDFAAQWSRNKEKMVFEFHSHSTCSDGYLSPSKLVERAHQHGVKVLALTDHDTMSGVPEALEAARRFGIKIIPGVEISTIFSPRGESGPEEPVHILAYYSGCGPKRPDELEKFLTDIRDGRFFRAKNMISKLNKLELPLKWEQVAKIAGKDAAPGRLHVARALVEAGHVENLKQAFARYLYDGGPAYSTGSEPVVEEAVKLIGETGGVSVLAHPWALKNPVAIIRKLKEVGLHGIEVYRSDGKLSVFSDLADAHELVKLGGSDYHGRGGQSESELGSVSLPVTAVHDFLKVGRPIWCGAISEILENYVKEPSSSSDSNLKTVTAFMKTGCSCRGGGDLIEHCLSSCLTIEERRSAEFEAIKLKLSYVSINQETSDK